MENRPTYQKTVEQRAAFATRLPGVSKTAAHAASRPIIRIARTRMSVNGVKDPQGPQRAALTADPGDNP